jgi:uncharacterized protein YecE (DUF72 family)
MKFFIGCAIWAYKDWVGNLYPSGSRSVDFLSLYSQRLTTVEGNTTFYSIPDAKIVARWAAQTPDGFQFCLKLPRSITHQGLLAPMIPEAIAFLNQMKGLGDRLGPLFAQLPPSYSPANWEDLLAFLRSWQSDQAPLALEVRHADWFKEPHASQLNAALQDLGVGRVLLDSRPIYDCPDDPQLYSERRKPRVPLQQVITADFSLIRYISHPDQNFNLTFLQDWVSYIGNWLAQGKQIYFFVHCPVEARSPTNLRLVQHILQEQGIPIPPLPWNELSLVTPSANLTDSQSTQLSLF